MKTYNIIEIFKKSFWVIICISSFLPELKAQQAVAGRITDATGGSPEINNLDSKLSKFAPFLQALRDFSNNIPQEKVCLHFDNTSYYQGDHIRFKCYITSAQHQLSNLSKTLYVELLNPGGETVDKRILKIENGQCHGDFTLNQLPFYSGFYEVRAYTKYMLNFGDDVIFSRLLPVFNKPKTEGNFEEKEMLSYGWRGAGAYPMKREKPERGKEVNVRFFPEGGNLLQGVASRVAFEATDQYGNPIDVTGVVMDENRQEVSRFATQHEGRGIFTYTPGMNTGKQRAVAEVEYSGRKYQFDMPVGLPQGVVMETDNLSHPDSIGITLRKNRSTPDQMLGVAILNGGKLQNYCFAWIEDDEVRFKMDKTRLPAGVSQIALFNSKGEILCDRLIFNARMDNFLDIKAKTSKPAYRPCELVEMEFSVTDREANPVSASFSLSVRDGESEVESNHTILTDLLLMSEIKGYVRNPSYYFEEKGDSVETGRAPSLLDVLLMVQGWRRYSWKQMAGVEPFELKYFPEQGIETHGSVVNSRGRQIIPKPQVDVSLLLLRRTENDSLVSLIETFVTDSLGRFSFVSDVEGKWNMILSVKEKGKAKKYMILADRVFNPEPKRYRYADLQVNIVEKANEIMTDEELPDDDSLEASFLAAYQDSLAKLGMDKKVHLLEEITVKAKRRTREQDILYNRSTSIAYCDAASELDDLYDKGYVANNIYALLANMNLDFSSRKPMLFVIDYNPVVWSEVGRSHYRAIRLPAIKSIYVNKNMDVIAQYIVNRTYDISSDEYGNFIRVTNPIMSPMEMAMCFSYVVFIETYPEGEVPVDGAKGVRKTWLDGYSAVSEFYSPDYSMLPPAPDDYRRTLYWNPSVIPDENGNASIQFYNNSRCRNFSISAETVTPQGMIGIYRKEE